MSWVFSMSSLPGASESQQYEGSRFPPGCLLLPGGVSSFSPHSLLPLPSLRLPWLTQPAGQHPPESGLACCQRPLVVYLPGHAPPHMLCEAVGTHSSHSDCACTRLLPLALFPSALAGLLYLLEPLPCHASLTESCTSVWMAPICL